MSTYRKQSGMRTSQPESENDVITSDIPCTGCGRATRLTFANVNKTASCECGATIQLPPHPLPAPLMDPYYAESGIPRVFEHGACGHRTVMPEEIVKNYLIDPEHYSRDAICAHCGTDFPMREFHFVATGEWLDSYFTKLVEAKGPRYKTLGRVIEVVHFSAAIAIGVFLPGNHPWWLRLIAGVIAIFIVGPFLHQVVKFQICKRGFV